MLRFAERVPDNLRDSIESRLRENPQEATQLKRMEQVYGILTAEANGVDKFAQLANELGFPIQNVQASIDAWRRKPIALMKGTAPIPEPDSRTALAQHHGIPTRLLDWTWNPLFAAFFAIDGMMWRDIQPSPQHFAVWAIETRRLAGQGRVKLLEPLGSQNPYLRAQRGILIWDAQAERQYMEEGVWHTMDAILPELTEVRRLELPVSEARRLRRLLLAESVSRAHLMPSLDNVAIAVLASEHDAR